MNIEIAIGIAIEIEKYDNPAGSKKIVFFSAGRNCCVRKKPEQVENPGFDPDPDSDFDADGCDFCQHGAGNIASKSKIPPA